MGALLKKNFKELKKPKTKMSLAKSSSSTKNPTKKLYQLFWSGCLLFFFIFFSHYHAIIYIQHQAHQWVMQLMMPVICLLNEPYKKIRQFFLDDDVLMKEGVFFEKLTQSVNQIEKWKALALNLQRENEELKTLLNVPSNETFHLKTFKVLGSLVGFEYKTLVVRFDKKLLIQEDIPVLSSNGLVGRILFSKHHPEIYGITDVMLITHPFSRVPVKFSSTGEQAILAGNGTNFLDIIHHDHQSLTGDTKKVAALKNQQDILVTSGMGGIYPENLPVAKILVVKGKERSDTKLVAIPLVRFQTLSYINVLLRHDHSPSHVSTE